MKRNLARSFILSVGGVAMGLLFLWFLAVRSEGQSNPQPAQQSAPTAQEPSPANLQTAPVIKKESRLVLVDAVVTDHKGNYVSDLKQDNFRVYEDKKEQTVSSFSFGSDPTAPVNSQKRYMVFFFDNASMEMPDQMAARSAATKFIQSNAGPDHLMAVVEFTGVLQVKQNFTANADLLRAAANGLKTSSVASNVQTSDILSSPSPALPGISAVTGSPSISTVASDYGARSMLLAIRSLAKNLRAIPGRKMLVLFSSGFPLTPEQMSELTATIDACNKANVAVYPVDARGLVAVAPGGSARNGVAPLFRSSAFSIYRPASFRLNDSAEGQPRLLLAAFPQRPVGPGGSPGAGPGGGGGRGGPGGTGGTGGGGGRGGTGGTGGTGGSGGRGGTGGTGGGGTRGTGGGNPGGTRGGGYGGRPGNYSNYYNNPLNQPRNLIPTIPPSATTNQEVLAALADGTGGFTIFNTNDLLGGLERIAREQNEFYLLGYVPAETPEGSCHTLKVKLEHVGGLHIRSRTGYCNARPSNILDGTSVEKQLELHAREPQAGSIHAAMAAPYFYSGPGVARVDLAMDIPPDNFHFEKEKGKYHADLDVLGIAYRPDGTVGARFSDQVKLDLEKDEWKEFKKDPYHYENQFDAAPGTYKLTVVLSAGGDSFGKVESPLEIDPYDGKQFSMGAAVMTNSAQRVSDLADSTDLDATLLEDHTPLVVKGLQVVPLAENRFKRSDNVIVYSEIYEPLLISANPPRVVMGYKIFDRTTNKQVFFTGSVATDEFIHKGNPVIPVGLKVMVKDLPLGKYRLAMLAIDGAGRSAPERDADFDVTE
jgi:VWFA-related protein